MKNKTILLTGGAGFIGSHLSKYLINKYPDYRIIVYDKLSYAGNINNLTEILHRKHFTFIQGDVADFALLTTILAEYQIDSVIHLAAETHVDNSIETPLLFANTNSLGTLTLLEACKTIWQADDTHLFLQVSTDEVFGSITAPAQFDETSAYRPQSPYSASKAAADHFIRASHNTHHFPAIISFCGNNFGPNQYHEKLIPLIISNAIQGQTLPIYGSGFQVRDWIFVLDHVIALDLIFHQGKIGESYVISAQNQISNLELVNKICRLLEKKLALANGTLTNSIVHIKDRLGHDFRYALNPTKINLQFNWQPQYSFDAALDLTLDWYLNNPTWLKSL